MKLKKAIEKLSKGLPADTWKLTPDLKDAIKLLIEAGKRVEGNRHYPQPTVYPLLPGETKD